MHERSARRWAHAALPLLVAALAIVPVAVMRAIPAADLASLGLAWAVRGMAAVLAVASAVAALAWLVGGLRRGGVAALLSAGAGATVAGGAVTLAGEAAPLTLPLAGGAVLLLGAAIADRLETAIDSPAARIATAAAVLVGAELLVLASLVPAVADAVTEMRTPVLAAAAAVTLAAAIVAAGRPLAGVAAATVVGITAVAVGRADGVEELIGLAALSGASVLAIASLPDMPAAFVDDTHRLPGLASRMADAVLRFDGRLRLHDWNAAAGSLLGLDPASAGTHLEDLLGVPLADLPARDATVAAQRGVGGLEIELERSDGGVIAIVRDPAAGASGEAERLGRELRGTIEELLQARRTIELQRQEIERATTTDRLTGVPTRAAIVDRLRLEIAQARRYRHQVAIVLLDVDRFGEINRTHGTAGGDAVLREVALRIRLRVREADALGRAGSDCFLAVLPHTDEGGAATFAAALRHRIGLRPVAVAGEQVPVSVSIGVAIMRAGEDLDLDGLLARAEEALASARSAGGDRIALDRLHGLARLEDHRSGELPDLGVETESGT